jgi:hypothetical protein
MAADLLQLYNTSSGNLSLVIQTENNSTAKAGNMFDFMAID